MWFKACTRRIGVQVAMAWNYGIGGLTRSRYGIGMDRTLVFWDGRKTDYYFDADELEAFEKGIFALLRDDEFVTTMPWEAK